MKWRACSEWKRHRYFTGPDATYFKAKSGGVRYEVCCRYAKTFARSGPVVWWSHNGKGDNRQWKTKEAAMAWCEQDAAQRNANKRAAVLAEGGV